MLFLAAIGLFALSACNKSYTCKCEAYKANGTYVNTDFYNYTGSKKQAERDCKVNENVRGDVTTACDLVD